MTAFEQLERQLIVSVGRRRRWHGRLGRIPASATVAAAGVIALAVAGGVLLLIGHRTPSRSLSGGTAAPIVPKNPALPYLIYAADATRGECGRATASYLIRDVSILGILRRPASAADRPPPTRGNLTEGAYLPFFRRARTVDGATYYIWPEVWPIPGAAALHNRCIAAERAALRREHLPVNLRAAALRDAGTFFAAPVLYPGICLGAVHVPVPPPHLVGRFFNFSECGATAAEIEQGGILGSAAGDVTGVLPDGVASVTLRYKDGRAFSQRIVGNVLAIKVTLERGSFYRAEIWRAADGSVIKTIRP
jgi:hypothetical protein